MPSHEGETAAEVPHNSSSTSGSHVVEKLPLTSLSPPSHVRKKDEGVGFVADGAHFYIGNKEITHPSDNDRLQITLTDNAVHLLSVSNRRAPSEEPNSTLLPRESSSPVYVIVTT